MRTFPGGLVRLVAAHLLTSTRSYSLMLPNYANSHIIVACYISRTVSGLPHCVVWAAEAAGKERKQPH